MNRSATLSLCALIVASIGFLYTIAFFIGRANYLTAFGIAVEWFGVGTFVISAVSRINKRLRSIRPKNKQLAFHYDHIYIWCKDSARCPRCRGWYAGFVFLFAFVGAIILGELSATFIPGRIGSLASVIVGIVLISLTPIHGAVGRIYNISRKHWVESPFILGGLGFCFALGILFVAEAIIAVL